MKTFPPACWSIPEGTIWAVFVTCHVLRVRFFSCFPERCPYRSIGGTHTSKKGEKRLYRYTDWTYASTRAVEKRINVSGGGWKGPSGHQSPLPEGGDLGVGYRGGCPGRDMRPNRARERLPRGEPFSCPERGSNPHVFKGHWILSPARLPIPPSGQDGAGTEAGARVWSGKGKKKIRNLQRI